MTLTIDPETGQATDGLSCGHPLSAVRQEWATHAIYCFQCKTVAASRTDRERHLAALRARARVGIDDEGYDFAEVTAACVFAVAELERGAAATACRTCDALREDVDVLRKAFAALQNASDAVIETALKTKAEIESLRSAAPCVEAPAQSFPTPNECCEAIEATLGAPPSFGERRVADVVRQLCLKARAPVVEAPAPYPSEEECVRIFKRAWEYSLNDAPLSASTMKAIREMRALCLRARSPAPAETAGEFPTIEECMDAWTDAPGGVGSGLEAVRQLCLAARAPKVEWPAWFVDYVRWVNEKPGAKYATAPENGWRELLALIEGKP